MDYGIFDKYVEQVKSNGLPTKVVEGDLTESEGALIFDGNVIVNGKIASNAVIEASGDVITPCIEFAQVYTKGTFYADLITGAGQEQYAIVRAKEGVVAGLIQYANVISYADIDVLNEVRHSDLFAESRVNILEDSGGIVGGTVSGYAGVNSGFIGTASKLETRVIAGYSRRLIAELEKGKSDIEELERKLDSCKVYVDKIHKTDNDKKKKELQEYYETLKSDHAAVVAKVAELEETLKIDVMPEVRFSKVVFEGVQIAIGRVAMLMDATCTEKGRFVVEGDVIKILNSE